MLNGNIKLACLEAQIKALELAKQNRKLYLSQNKEIPEYMYDKMNAPKNGILRRVRRLF